jgi:aminoglycoside/choline kinase family phosphotransferase
MKSPKMPDGPPVRGGKPYSAIAHLAEDVKPFVAVATALRAAGFGVPEILAHDLEQGFLVIEDLGDRLYGAEIAVGADAGELYRAATDVLVALRQFPVPDRLPLPDGTAHVLPPYDGGALQIEVELLLDWFWPLVKGETAPEAVRADFLIAWRPLFDRIGEESPGWVLRDYHSPNLIWLAERGGIARVGILDFQDALKGPCVYDLVSLAQDARRDVPETLEAALTEHYCAGVGAADASFDRDRFTAAYAILGAQRSTKILGIFARLAMRDAKPGYIDHIPRVSAYLARNLVHASLADLRAWYERHLPAETRERAGRA